MVPSSWPKYLRLPVWFGVLAALCLPLTQTAHAQSADRVQFGNNIVVRDGEEVGDTVCFLCSIEVDGTVHGDTVAFLGSIRVRGKAEQDAVAFLGNISLGDDASVGQDVVVFGGSLHTGQGATIGSDRVVFPFVLLLFPLFVLAGFIALIVWAVRSIAYRRRPIYGIPPPRF